MANTTPPASNHQFGHACVSCNQKKTRCKLLTRGGPCESCASLQIQCLPRTRKRRRAVAAGVSSTTLRSLEPLRETPMNDTGDLRRSESNQGVPNASPISSPSLPIFNSASTRSLIAPGTSTLSGQLSSQSIGSTVRQDTCSFMHPLTDNQNPGASSLVAASVATPANEAGGDNESEAHAVTYIGRSYYIGEDTALDESLARSYTPAKLHGISSIEIQTLQLWGSFELPPKPVRQSLMECFMEYCYPWMPTLSSAELQQGNDKFDSILLMQSMFLAASRLSLSPSVMEYTTSEQFYHRAKALFWAGHERNPLTVIKSITMLHWYNPDGPAYVSYDASEFWLKVGVGLAYQMGLHKETPRDYLGRALRRRVWWSLVVRDSLISVSHGRPRAINLDDCETSLPCQEDFPESAEQGELFIYYVEICCLLGDLAACCSKGRLSIAKRVNAESVLFRWIHTLPPHLQLSPKQLRTYGNLQPEFRARQLHIPYLICLAILGRSASNSARIVPAAILASSFVAGIFECFLARDQVKFLSPVFTNFCLISGIVLLSAGPHPHLWDAIQPDLEVLQKCLSELSKKWRSAIGASKALQKAIDVRKASRSGASVPPLIPLSKDQLALFEGLSFELCRIWPVYNSQFSEVYANPADPQDRNVHATGLGSGRVADFIFTPGEGGQNFANLEVGGDLGSWFMDDWDYSALL